MKNWRVLRQEILTAVLRLQPGILTDKSLMFRHGSTARVAIEFRYGFVGIDRDNLLILGIKQSTPQDFGVRLIEALTQHCQKQKINLAIVPLDQGGRPIDTHECLTIRL